MRYSSCLAALAAAASLVQQSNADTPDAALIDQLDAPAYAERRDARRRLESFDAADLRPFADNPIVADLLAAAEARGDGEPSRLTIDFDGQARGLVAEINRRCGVELTLHADLADAPATFACDDAPLWHALIDLADRHGWALDVSARGRRRAGVMLAPRPEGEPSPEAGPRDLRGPALTRVVSGRLTRSLDFAAGTAGATLSYDFEANLEPRFQIGPRTFAVEWARAHDAAGRSLMAELPDDVRMAGGGGLFDNLAGPTRIDVQAAEPATAAAEFTGGRLRFRATLDVPAGTAPSRVDLAGTVRGLVGAGMTDVTADLTEAQPPTWVVAGEPVVVRLLPSDRAGRWVARFNTLRPVDEPLEALIAASLAGCEMSDADGAALKRRATRDPVAEECLVYEVEFSGETPPARVTARVPSRAAWLEVPFAFDDLPVP